MNASSFIFVTCVSLVLSTPLYGQSVYENTYTWQAGQDHSGWKALSNFPSGYVIAGSKFFEPNNQSLFLTGFNDFCQEEWATTISAAAHGFSTLDTFWKSMATAGPPSNPTGFFMVASGQRNGSHHYYGAQTHKTGAIIKESFGPLGAGINFGGASQAVDGGYVAVGGTNAGLLAVVKFNDAGDLVTSTALPFTGFGWTIQPAAGGGYVIGSTSARATRISNDLNLEWTTTIPLALAPPPDGSMYTYTEFEEILPMQNTGSGFIMTGSAFSNSHSAAYSTRLDWNGNVIWHKINETTNTQETSTPVNWTNSAVEHRDQASGNWDILYTWRSGPVSTGGVLKAERMNPATGAALQKGHLGNTIPVQEAFTVRQYFTDRIIVAGTRGRYIAAYSIAMDNVPSAISTLSAVRDSAPAAIATRQSIGITNAPRVH